MAGFNSTIVNLTTNMSNLTTTDPNITTTADIWTYVREDPMYLIAESINIYTYQVIISLGTLLNAVILVTMMSSLQLRNNSSGFLIIWLASFELVDCIARIYYKYFDSISSCRFQELFFGVIIFVANNTILLIAINRFALVCFPFKHRRFTDMKPTIIQVAVLPVLGFGANCFLFGVKFYLRDARCFVSSESFDFYFSGLVPVFSCFATSVPILGTLILTILVIVRLRRRGNLKDATSRQGKSQQAERNITKAMMGVGISFVLLTVPWICFWFVHYYVPSDHSASLLSLFGQIFMYLRLVFHMNRISNFFVYLGYHTRFRVRMIQLLKCKWKAGTGEKNTV